MQVQAVQDVGLQPALAGAGTGLEAFVQQVLAAEEDATPLLFQLLIELVDRRIAVLVERAKTVIGNYWTERDRVTHEHPRSEWSRLGVRAPDASGQPPDRVVCPALASAVRHKRPVAYIFQASPQRTRNPLCNHGI